MNHNFIKKKIFTRVILTALFGALGGFAAAQSATATLSGTVVDEQGGVVPNVNIILENSATALKRTAVTNSEGAFTITLLTPDTYTLRAELQGFALVEVRDIALSVNDKFALRIELKVGQLTDTVTVDAGASLVQSQSVEVSALVDERRVKELPLNGKNFQRLILLAPGVGAGGNNPAINGGRPSTNTYIIDGVGTSDQREARGLSLSGGAALFSSGSPNLISTEAIREFRVITSNADATFGRDAGGQIDIVTKSGANDAHGSLYYFLRNDALDARDFFNTGPFFDSEGNAKNAPFKQHLFGGTLGGPIFAPGFGEGTPAFYNGRNRHFFFISYEGFRQKLQQTDATTVIPNAALISLIPGDLGRFYRTFFIERGIIPATGNPSGEFRPIYTAANRQLFIDAGFNPVLFDENLANGEAGSVRISSTRTRDVDQTAFLIRTDHNFSNRIKANFRYAYARPNQLTNLLAFPDSNILTPLRWQHGVTQVNFVLSSNQIFELRAGFLRSEYQEGSASGIAPSLRAIGVPEFGLFVNPSGTGLSQAVSNSSRTFIDNQTVPEATLTHTWTRGNFVLRSGFQVRKSFLDTLSAGSATAVYNFSDFLGQNGLLGANASQSQAVASSASVTIFGTGGGVTTPLRGWRQTEQEYFTQADWRVLPNLTLNLGLRYSYFSPLSETNNILSNLYAADSSGNIAPNESPFEFGRTSNVVARVDINRPFSQPDRDNFQPRIGVAYDIGGKGRTIVRAGYGLFANRLYQLVTLSAPNSTPFSISGSVSQTPFRLGTPIPINPNVPGIFGIDPTIRNPQTHRYNVAVQQILDNKTSVTVSYVGAAGRGLTWNAQVNGGNAGVPQALRPDPRFANETIAFGNGSSDYNALQVFAERRLSAGFNFTVAYTYASSKDNVSDDAFGSPPALINLGGSPAPGFQGGGAGQWQMRPLEANRGLSDFDIKHNLTISHLVELPFGRGRRFLSNASGFVQALIGGYSLAGIAILRSGQPFSIILAGDLADIGAFSIRPGLLSGNLSDLYAGGGNSRTQYLVTADIARSILGTPSNVNDPFSSIERNAFRAPSVYTYDVSLIKRFYITERVQVGLEVNAFNVFNRTNFGAPNTNLSSAFFGQVSGLAPGTTPRQLQFGLKLNF